MKEGIECDKWVKRLLLCYKNICKIEFVFFKIGQNINFYERVFRIIDCDAFTKEFFVYMGARLNPPEQVPTDSFDAQKKLKDIKI